MSEDIQPVEIPAMEVTGGDPQAKLHLPYNLESGLGGIDATAAAFDPNAFRPGLFDFDKGERSPKEVHWREGDQECSDTFGVPRGIAFAWSTQDKSVQVSGQTKSSFQRNMTNELGAGVSIGGFSSEFSRTFKEDTLEETFLKYAAHYERQQIYSANFIGHAIDHLSAEAIEALDGYPVAELIDTFGTHYTHKAIMGGLEIMSAVVDVRDTVEKRSLEDAVKLRYESGGDSAHASYSHADATVKALHNAMSGIIHYRLGEGAGNREEWLRSQYGNPSMIGHELKPLSELVPTDQAARRAEIDAEIARRLAGERVTSTAQMLAMRVPLKQHANDHMTDAISSLGVGRPQLIAGWYYVGDWAQQDQTFPAGYEALIFGNIPDADGAPAIRSAEATEKLWEFGGMGLFTPRPIGGYSPVGDIFDEHLSSSGPANVDYYGLVRDDLLMASSLIDPAVPFWSSLGGKSSPIEKVGALFIFPAGEEHGAHERDKTVWPASGGPQVHMFKAASSFMWENPSPQTPPKRIDMSKVHVVPNSWLSSFA